MAENDEKPIIKINGFTTISNLKENLTIIDISHKNISDIDENIKFPEQLCEINLSNNKLEYVPQPVMQLKFLKRLDISSNCIQYFDDTPYFCHEIEELDISNNKLLSPPYWIWSESPTKLQKINLSNNITITSALQDTYFKELLQYKCLVKDVIIYNCRLSKYIEILSTFCNAESIELGAKDLSYMAANVIEDVPSLGLDKCCDIERLNLCFTFVCNISPKINIYKNLREIDLSQNKISGLPKEFCQLENLVICLLSFNSILYLPTEIVNLKKLEVLCINNNELCMLPEEIGNLENLKKLDLYDNFLNDLPDLGTLEEIDLAQNYFEEPDDELYLEKRNKIRLHIENRYSGRKPEVTHEESDHTTDKTDDEFCSSGDDENNEPQERPSSNLSEDWDSEDWWQPHYTPKSTIPPQSQWLTFVKRKMEEGHFCPSDLHTVSISERVKYEKICNPRITREVNGQFDDLSDDES
ncbi:leucine-rich repeat protein soc-2 homolog isoform X2 [Zerene cesonia]|uniref:leucine-rich repeat protein soc-2 homolog isoform X2 n=1 Tax=Zerene cesonia TaxID=33412 RepID=UPI0018E599AC|nr:leucine-rich repeat protein soc-2 homolog isoform X2 [Zerene cesonia]